MKPKIVFLLGISSACILTGCGEKADFDSILNSDEEYKQCMALMSDENNTFDESGYYVYDGNTSPSDPIHVSLAENSTMRINYYLDEEMTRKIDGNECYLSPGDYIFASAPLFVSNGTNKQTFDGFRIFCVENDGNRIRNKSLEAENADVNGQTLKVLHIPLDFEYTDISIIPIGNIEDRLLRFNDFIYDDDGKAQPLDGQWTVNIGESDKTTIGEELKINPVSDYIIKYSYDPEKYSFIQSEPKEWHHDEKIGYVEFHQQSADNAIDEYNIELSDLVKFTFSRSDLIGKNITVDYSVDGSEYAPNPSKWAAKQGYIVMIRISNYGVSALDQLEQMKASTSNLKLLKVQQDDDYTIWTYEVNESNGKMIFDPNSISYENGRVKFIHNGTMISSAVEVSNGDKITYEMYPDKDFYTNISSDDITKVNVEYLEYELANKIEFVKKSTVQLIQPENGAIIYYLNDKQVIEESIGYLEGKDKLTADFKANDGFRTELGNKTPVIVDDKGQVRFAKDPLNIDINNSLSVDEVFYESVEGTAKVNVTLDKSVGDTVFKIYGCKEDKYNILNEKEENQKYSGTIFGSKEILNDNISLTRGIDISATSSEIMPGKALKYNIVITDEDTNKQSTYVYYGTSLPDKISIPLKTVYIKEISVNISKADIQTFAFNKGYTHPDAADIQVSFCDTNEDRIIQNGDIIENDTKVTLKLIPKPGYIITDKKGNKLPDNIFEKRNIKFKNLDDEYINMIINTNVLLGGENNG